MRREDQELRREASKVLRQPFCARQIPGQSDDGCRPFGKAAQVHITFDIVLLKRPRETKYRRRRRCRQYLADSLSRPLAIEAEATGATEELRRAGDGENGFEANAELANLSSPLARHVRVQDRVDAVLVDRRSLIRTVERIGREGQMDLPGRPVLEDGVSGVLDQLVDLTMAVATAQDFLLYADVFSEQVWLHLVSRERAPRLFSNMRRDS